MKIISQLITWTGVTALRSVITRRRDRQRALHAVDSQLVGIHATDDEGNFLHVLCTRDSHLARDRQRGTTAARTSR